MSRIDIKSITLMRAEGPNYLFGKNEDGSMKMPTETVKTLIEAGKILSQDWCKTSTGQDDVDFIIEVEDGVKYKGVYELQREHDEKTLSFYDDFIAKIEMYSGLKKPSSMEEDSWQNLISMLEKNNRIEAYRDLILKYNIPETEELIEMIKEQENKKELKI